MKIKKLAGEFLRILLDVMWSLSFLAVGIAVAVADPELIPFPPDKLKFFGMFGMTIIIVIALVQTVLDILAEKRNDAPPQGEPV